MTRDKAYQILIENIKNPNLIKHHLAAEAVMKTLAKYFYEGNLLTDQEKKGKNYTEFVEVWGIVGLLHDADYEETKDQPEKHGILLEEKLGNEIEKDIMYAIMAHNWQGTKVEPKSLMDWSMYCCDELTGLIIAAALVHPDKKLMSLTTDFILNRFTEKSFAKGANREQIKMCEQKLRIPLKEFIEISLKSMQEISNNLGL